MNQTFQVKKAEAPAKFTGWKLPVGWVTLTDEENNSITAAVMKDGVLHSDCYGGMGPVIGHQDCAETCKAALALFA